MSTAPEKNILLDDALSMIKGLLKSEPNPIANMANVSALLFEALPDVNWVGFYLMHDDELVLGPFQGRVACTRIALGRGVCGAAAQTKSVQRVADVHQFAGHIACDGVTESEIVLPIVVKDVIYGVLDIDSPLKNRFSETDQKNLEIIVGFLEKYFSAI